MMNLEIRSEKTMGINAMQIVTQRAMQMNMYIFLRKPGPTICSSIFSGLSDNSSLPVGRGRYGLQLGSSLA